jgi:hypothetical protein
LMMRSPDSRSNSAGRSMLPGFSTGV